jgi:thiol-disulfide isomerase/thioredoxin
LNALVLAALLLVASDPAAPPRDPRVPERLPLASEVPERPGLVPNGQFAPDFELPRLDSAGGSFRLSEHVGPVASAVEGGPDAALVAFMASWCGICHKSLPTLKELQEEHGERLLIVVVSTDATDEKAGEEAKRVEAAGLKAPVVRGDAATLTAWLGRDRGVPRYFFVNRIGEIIVKDKGFGSKVKPMMPKQARWTLAHPEYVER